MHCNRYLLRQCFHLCKRAFRAKATFELEGPYAMILIDGMPIVCSLAAASHIYNNRESIKSILKSLRIG